MIDIRLQMKKWPCVCKVLAEFIMVLASFSSFIPCIFKLIYKLWVERSKRENLYLNTPTWEQFNFYFIKWVLLVPCQSPKQWTLNIFFSYFSFLFLLFFGDLGLGLMWCHCHTVANCHTLSTWSHVTWKSVESSGRNNII